MTENKSLKTVAIKMGVKEHSKTYFVNSCKEVIDSINLPILNVQSSMLGEFDYIHLFVKKQSAFVKHFPILKKHLKTSGMLWVSWPKGGKLETDLNIKIVIKLGYEFGLVESTCLSINEIWSGLKFTHPQKGKKYNNSYGTLNEKD